MCESAGRLAGVDNRRTSVPRASERPRAALPESTGGSGVAEIASRVLDKAISAGSGLLGGGRHGHVDRDSRPAAIEAETLEAGGAGVTKEAALRTTESEAERKMRLVLRILSIAKEEDSIHGNERAWQERILRRLSGELGFRLGDLSDGGERRRAIYMACSAIRTVLGTEVFDEFVPKFLLAKSAGPSTVTADPAVGKKPTEVDVQKAAAIRKILIKAREFEYKIRPDKVDQYKERVLAQLAYCLGRNWDTNKSDAVRQARVEIVKLLGEAEANTLMPQFLT